MRGQLAQLHNLLFPAICPSCKIQERGSSTILCESCFRDLDPNHHACPLCAAPLPDHENDAQETCRSCHGRGIPGIKHCYVNQIYSTVMRDLVVAAKVQARRAAHHALGQLISDMHPDLRQQQIDAVCVIPPSPGRRYGPHLATFLARTVAKVLQKPTWFYLKQNRLPAAQHELPAHMRQKNTRHLFRIQSETVPQHILLVDDLITSGHTISAAAQCLKQHGAKQIYATAVARSIFH